MANELWVPLLEVIPALGKLERSGTSKKIWADQSSAGQGEGQGRDHHLIHCPSIVLREKLCRNAVEESDLAFSKAQLESLIPF